MVTSMSIGIVDLSSDGWSAGHTYSWVLAASLHAARAKVSFLSDQDAEPQNPFPTVKLPPEQYLPGEWTIRRLFGTGRRNRIEAALRRENIRVVGPLPHPAMLCKHARNIAWIPDFQPFFLRHLYDKEEIKKVSIRTKRLLEGCEKVIVSSEDSRNALGQFFPKHVAKACVLRFPSIFAFHPPAVEPVPAFVKYSLPTKFILVANQLWKHKNHSVVPEALAILRDRGIEVPCVMTGLPSDFRDRSNSNLSALLQKIATLKVWDLCRVLGHVPRVDLVSFLRTASALVQPSCFEGWNTTVQDAQALGCPLLVSDLPVHREQCQDRAVFFEATDPGVLADVIASHWATSSARPDSAAEAAGLATEKEFASRHGQLAKSLFAA